MTDLSLRFRRTLAIAALTAALGVAACSSKPAGDPAPLDEGNIVEAENLLDTNIVDPVATPPENATNTTAAAPQENLPPSEQMFEDADASGMTARLPAEEDSAPAAERVEKQ